MRQRLYGAALASLVAIAGLAAVAPAATAQAPIGSPRAPAALVDESPAQPGFQESTVWSGLIAPTAIRFAPDGRVFVAEKSGLIKTFDSVDDLTPTTYADLRTATYDYGDRGLLGLELDPAFTAGRPYVYVAYTYDAAIGGTAPRWNDQCPDPDGTGCIASGRLSRLNGGVETVLVNDWCQQFTSHSVGALAFGPDGALYVSGGEGASYTFADIGQQGNTCADPPNEGGALRSQDVRTSADPSGLGGSVLRVDPDTGLAMADNPNAASSDVNTRRIIAHGLRNPFRFALRPGTTDVYVGDVGWIDWEEINRIPSPAAPVENFGWPCYEGNGRQGSYDGLNVSMCENLYSAGSGAVAAPLYTYHHAAKVSTETCPTGGSATSGMEFYDGGTFPAQYNGALFFADYARGCIWVMFAGANGIPDPATRQPFVEGAGGAVDLQVGPGGDLFYVDIINGQIRRVHATNGNQAPTANASATPTEGAAPLTVSFDGTGSTDPNGDTLAYAWDLDGDGAYDDSSAAQPTQTYTTTGIHTIRLRVTDPSGLQDTDSVTITVGTPPTPTISTPAAGTTWKVADVISFAGSAVDGQGNPLPPSALSWQLVLQHCAAIDPSSCHQHVLQSFSGASGSFTTPDHDYPAYLELVLTATDGGLSASTTRRLDPQTVALTFETQPAGLQLSVANEQQATPFTRTAIRNATVALIAPTPQSLAGTSYDFGSWSDGGARVHNITAPSAPATYRATYTAGCPPAVPGLVGAWGFDEASGTLVADSSGSGNAGSISGATRIASGRYGPGLTFDGVNDWVTVPDSPSLDLTSAATLEGWVFPTAGGTTWRTMIFKERPGGGVYAVYSNDETLVPSGWVSIGTDQAVPGSSSLPLNAWSHLAMTYDGQTMVLYVNGARVGARAQTGAMNPTSDPLRFGGNSIWSEWFAGRMDELRIYNRALSQAEVQTDMNTAVTCTAPPAAPVLAVAPSSLSYSAVQGAANPPAQTLDITNTGGGTLSFTASDDQPWLSVAPASGNAPASLSVTVDTAGLAPGTYNGTVTVTAAGASGSPKTVAVTLNVTAPPALAVAPSSLTFNATQGAANPASQSVSVTNSGGGTLSFTASDDRPWLSVTPASGSAPSTLSVAVDIAGLAPGTHTGTVTVTAAGASGSPKTVAVTLNVAPAPPVLAVAPSSLTFNATQGAANPPAQSVSVTNTGGGTLSFTASGDQPWLSVAPASGDAPASLSVTVDTAGLAPGTYNGTVTVTAAGASGSPKTVGVTLNVTAPPALAVAPSSLTFNATQGAANPASQSVSVTNSGGGTLSFTASDDRPWLSVTPASGSAPSTLSVAVDIAGLAPGTHTGTVTVTAAGASGSPKTVAVTLNVAPPPPVLAVSPSSLSYSAVQGAANPPAQSVSVTNTGGGTLSFTASGDQPWLSVAPASGDAPASLSVTVDTAGLAPGTYNGTVTVTAAGASGSPKTVAVTLDLAPPPGTGLVGAWGFNEGAGASVADVSGAANSGSISGPTWTVGGRYGNALSFDGSNDLVTVPDSPTLDLTTAATFEAWVSPVVRKNKRAVLLKVRGNSLAYALYSSLTGQLPSAFLWLGSNQTLDGPAPLLLNTWTHLAMTWDGTTMRLYVGGVEVSSRAQTGTLTPSTDALRFGGTPGRNEWYSGVLDEIRIYNRALTAAEIQSDMNTPIAAP